MTTLDDLEQDAAPTVVDVGDGPRRWDAPPEPGADVTAVQDRWGKLWTRHGDGWCFVDTLLAHHHWRWSELFFKCAPLTDATRLGRSHQALA